MSNEKEKTPPPAPLRKQQQVRSGGVTIIGTKPPKGEKNADK